MQASCRAGQTCVCFGGRYTPAMAKRFNVSIPDALAERMEPFKSSLSLSSLMQNAIEQELIRLTMTDEKRDLKAQFKRAAVGAWFSRLPGLGEALQDFTQSLVDKAAKDGDEKVFELYRSLFFAVKGKEVLAAMERSYDTFIHDDFEAGGADPGQTDASMEASKETPPLITEVVRTMWGMHFKTHINRCEDMIESISEHRRDDFGIEFVYFLEKHAQQDKHYLGRHNYEEKTINGSKRLCLDKRLASEMGSASTEVNTTMLRIFFESLDSRMREMMSPEDIELFVTDLNPSFYEIEIENDI